MPILDPLDARILLAMDAHPGATTVALAQHTGLSRNTIQAHERRWTEQRRLAPNSTRVRPADLGHPLLAFVSMEISQRQADECVAALVRVPEVLELHATTGEGDMLARVVAADPGDLNRVTREILGCPGVVRTSSVLAMQEILPLRTAPLLRRLAGAGPRATVES